MLPLVGRYLPSLVRLGLQSKVTNNISVRFIDRRKKMVNQFQLNYKYERFSIQHVMSMEDGEI